MNNNMNMNMNNNMNMNMNNNMNMNMNNNQQIMLVNILNRMYNDNRSLINSLRNTLDNLIESNESNRNMMIRLLNNTSHNENIHNNENIHYDENIHYMINNIIRPIPRRRTQTIQTYRYNYPLFDITPIFTSSPNLENNNLIADPYDTYMEPVIVYPTQAQIELATRRIQYSDILEPNNTSCPILLEDFSGNDIVIEIRYCGHIFRPQPIITWFRHNCRCPVCRYDIREYNYRISNMVQENINVREETPIITRRTDPSNNVMNVNLTNDELFTIIMNSFRGV